MITPFIFIFFFPCLENYSPLKNRKIISDDPKRFRRRNPRPQQTNWTFTGRSWRAIGSESNPAQQCRVNARNLSKNKDQINNQLQSNSGFGPHRFSDNKPPKFQQNITVNCFRSRLQFRYTNQSSPFVYFSISTELSCL